MSFKITRPAITRRSVIASAGLAAAVGGSNFFAPGPSRAQDDGGLPPAADVLQRTTPASAPNLAFTDSGGRPLTLKNFYGSGLVVNIWATWCGPCVAEFPTLAAAAPQLAASRILVLPISIDAEGLKIVEPFYKSHNIQNVPILLDPDGNATDALQAPGIPITIIVDPRGRQVARSDGASNWNNPQTIALLQRLATSPSDAGGIEPV